MQSSHRTTPKKTIWSKYSTAPHIRTLCSSNQWWTVQLKDIFQIIQVRVYTPAVNRSDIASYFFCNAVNPFISRSSINSRIFPTLSISTGSIHSNTWRAVASLLIAYELDSTQMISKKYETDNLTALNIYSNRVRVNSSSEYGFHLKKVEVIGNGMTQN